MNQITITGKTTKAGEFGFYNINQLNDACKKNPDKTMVVTIEFVDKKSKTGLLSYYHAKVIPLWQDIFHGFGEIKNSIQVDVYLRGICPITVKKSLSELSYDELVMFMDTVKHHTLVEGNQFLEDARCL